MTLIFEDEDTFAEKVSTVKELFQERGGRSK